MTIECRDLVVLYCPIFNACPHAKISCNSLRFDCLNTLVFVSISISVIGIFLYDTAGYETLAKMTHIHMEANVFNGCAQVYYAAIDRKTDKRDKIDCIGYYTGF